MSRLTWVVAAGLLATSGVAFAEGQAELAGKLNDEGKQLMFGNDFAGASAKFRDAVARAPEPKYFFNLCMSLYQEGKFDDAFTACTAVGQNNPSAEQKDKADKLIGRIKEEAKSQGLELHLGGGGGGNTNVPPDPNNPTNPPDPNHPPETGNPPPNGNPPIGGGPPPNDPNYHPVVGRPPTAMLLGSKPDNHYTWSLGGDLYGGGGVMGGTYADTGGRIYGSAAVGFRLKGDYMLAPAQRLGAQGYVQYSQFTAGQKDTADAASLAVIDVGVALYKHLCLASAENICLTPLVGVHLASMSPQGDTGIDASSGNMTQVFNYIGVGGRAEVNLAIAFGTRQEHVLNVAVGANVYSKVLAGPADDPNGVAVGLDSGGSFGYLGVGYTYRFNTPFGSSPFVTLE